MLTIKTHFENSGHYLDAGKLSVRLGRYQDAVNLLLKCPYAEGKENPAIEYAIEAVQRAKSDSLTHKLIDYLMGLRDGITKVRN